jgi:ADP-L-glycero-D-manno-heptose 6-epimerase
VKILVTGAAGFIGSNLAIRLANDGHSVVGVDDFSSASWKNLINFRGDVVTGDVLTLGSSGRIGPFDVIFHEASITDTTVMDQRRMMQNNVDAFRALLELAREWGSRVVWASSASIYGQNPAPNKETQPPQPLNVYAYSKLAMERLAEQWQRELSHPIIGLRYFNVYGPGEDHKGKFASMIHQLAKQMRSGKRPRIFTAGQQKRDFVYVDDVIQANLKAMTCKTGGVFNVGSGKAFSFNQVVAELNRAFKTDLQPDYFDNPYSFTQDWTEADISHSRAVLGYEPKYDVPRGIDAYLESGKLGIGGS